MDQGNVLRRALSLKHAAFDSSESHSVSRPLSRSHSVSELVAKYQNVMDHKREKTSKVEQKVLGRNVQEIKRDFTMKATSTFQDQTKSDCLSSTCAQKPFPSPTSATTANSRFQTTRMSPCIKGKPESWKAGSTSLGVLNDCTKEKYVKTPSYSDQLDTTEQLKISQPSVKELSAVYLSKAAAASYRTDHTKPHSTEETVLSSDCPKFNKAVNKELCSACFKPVYHVERLVIDKVILHHSCFCCKHCRKRLSLHNYAVHLGELFCKVHHIQLIKVKGKEDQSLFFNPPEDQQMKMAETSGLGMESRRQQKRAEKTVKERALRWQGNAVDLNLQCDTKPQGEMHLRNNCNSKSQPRNKLGISRLPLANSTEGAPKMSIKAGKVKWPPQNHGLVVGSSTAVFNKVEMVINKVKKRSVITDHVCEEKKSSMSFSKSKRLFPPLNKTEGGKGILKDESQRPHFTDGNIPRKGKLSQKNRMSEKLTMLQHNKPTVKNNGFSTLPLAQIPGNCVASKTSGALPTSSRTFKAVQGTNQVLMTAVKPSVIVSVASKWTSNGNKRSQVPASKDTQSDEVKNISRKRNDPTSKPTQSAADPLFTSEPIEQKTGRLDTSNGMLLDEKESRACTDHDAAPNYETGNTSFVGKNLTPLCVTQMGTVKATKKMYTMDKVRPFIIDPNSHVLEDQNAKETSDLENEMPVMANANWKNIKMFTGNEALRKPNSNMAEREMLLLSSENGVGNNDVFKEILPGKNSYSAESQKSIPQVISHDSELEKAKTNVPTQTCLTDPPVFQFQKAGVLNSLNSWNHKDRPECGVLAENKVKLDSTKLLAGHEVPTSANICMETSTQDVHLGKINDSDNIHLKMTGSDDMLDYAKFHVSNSCAIEAHINHGPTGKSEDLNEPRNLFPTGSQKREGDTTGTFPQSKENETSSMEKEQVSEMSSSRKIPLPKVFISENKDSSNARKENKKPSLSKLKTQSAWGKLFGYSLDSITQEREQNKEVTKSTQKFQGTKSSTELEQNYELLYNTSPVDPTNLLSQKEDEKIVPNSEQDNIFLLVKDEGRSTQTESLLPLQNISALDSNVLSWVSIPDSSISTDKAFGTVDFQIQKQTDSKFDRLQQNEQLYLDLIQTKYRQEVYPMHSEDRSLPQADTKMADPTLITTQTTKEENHETLLPESFHSDHQDSKSTDKTCPELSQLRNNHQELMFYSEDTDHLQATGNNSHIISNPDILCQPNSDVSKSQPNNHLCSDFKPPEVFNNVLLKKSVSPCLVVESNVSIKTTNDNCKLINQLDILPKLQIDHIDPFGLGQDVVHPAVDCLNYPGANIQPAADPTLVQCIPDNLTDVIFDTLSSAAEVLDSALLQPPLMSMEGRTTVLEDLHIVDEVIQ